MVAPCVHLNGTSADELLSVRGEARAALRAALDALRQCAPNGRDYYLQPGTLAQAEAQHRQRVQALERVQDELLAEMEAICEQA